MFTRSDIHKVFDKYYSALVLYANRFLPLRNECEDLVQDIFVDLLEKKPVFPDETSLRAYLYKSTRNRCYNHLKHLKVRDKYASHRIQQVEEEASFLQEVMEEEISRQLYQAVESLSGRKREIIMLSLKGLKNSDIALTLGIQLQTVKTIKSSAYRELRALFSHTDVIACFIMIK
ncbi:sigma-70 family RNA polymerase sigma factor [Sinomicrobium soli]|uniref:sigma-70 family RNA polymerase sigma factor n=1 Tax=Sinomicrobium sp. N-1-3-6 TaxID=2219864 RepID=UPI000DCBDB7D|nr:sigma-70 family RNA polymerase sigma factor [Sinomicrobium sp. N-1-3-6]RAV29160.1 RNA polymerase sigma-70 factor [Sinomicrobium sp. N-1-3-6]